MHKKIFQFHQDRFYLTQKNVLLHLHDFLLYYITVEENLLSALHPHLNIIWYALQ